MIEKDLIEIIKAVNNIESDIFEQSNVDYFNISVLTNGYVWNVKFLNIILWSSEGNSSDEDVLDFDEIREKYKSIELYVRYLLSKELSKLRKINI